MPPIAYYFDESIDRRVPVALKRAGIDVLTAGFAGMRGKADIEQLAYASQLQRVLVAYDVDFLAVTRRMPIHAGVIYAWRVQYPPQRLVTVLLGIHKTIPFEAMVGRVIALITEPPSFELPTI